MGEDNKPASGPAVIDSAIRQFKANLQATFNTTAGYDSSPLRFFKNSAEFFVSLLDLRGDERVIDVATGTGHAAFALSGRLPHGQVTAVDFSKGMLDIARKKSAHMNIRNVEFLEMDMQAMPFEPASFDAAICAFGIFFAPDMDAQLNHIASLVKPGGIVAICSFQEDYFLPLREMAAKKMMEYGAVPPPPIWKLVATKDGCKELYKKAGIDNVLVEKANMGYFIKNENEWRDAIMNTGMRRMLDQLKPEDRDRFWQEHLKEVAALATEKGIWLDIGVLYTIGIK
jgi:ubiquinone/menaquinone biosynthesis C-methylase UbiE